MKLFACVGALLCGLAVVQASPPPSVTAPIKHYRPFNAKEKPVDWREANELVRALDGHLGHVRNEKKPLPPAPVRHKPAEKGKAP